MNKQEVLQAYMSSIRSRWPKADISEGLMQDWYNALKHRTADEFEKAVQTYAKQRGKYQPSLEDVLRLLPKKAVANGGIVETTTFVQCVVGDRCNAGTFFPVYIAPLQFTYGRDKIEPVALKTMDHCRFRYGGEWQIKYDTTYTQMNWERSEMWPTERDRIRKGTEYGQRLHGN